MACHFSNKLSYTYYQGSSLDYGNPRIISLLMLTEVAINYQLPSSINFPGVNVGIQQIFVVILIGILWVGGSKIMDGKLS